MMSVTLEKVQHYIDGDWIQNHNFLVTSLVGTLSTELQYWVMNS